MSADPTDSIYVEIELDAGSFEFGAFPFIPTRFHRDLYDAHEPINFAEAELGYPFYKYTAAIASMFDQIENYISPPDDEDIAWSMLMNVDTCPNEALPWLAQFIGADLSAVSDVDTMREIIKSRPDFMRGGIDVMASHASIWLTGNKTFFVRERDPDACPSDPAYGLTFVSLISETPNPAKVEETLKLEKPAGIVLNYYQTPGQDYQHLWDTHTSITDIETDYVTYRGVLEDTPGE